jgi:alginate O-acetyltransferase complex protein AlgI
MAISVAGFMGYKLVLNFDAPYLSVSIQDFWRRWHISLSSWIRDYIYLSLGGRHKSRLLTYRNLMITMLAGGLWHGANWTFVVWGGLHGGALVVNQDWYHRFKAAASNPSAPRRVLMWFLTLNFVCIAWIFFRSPDFEIALLMVKRYLFLDRGGMENLPLWLGFFGPALLAFQYVARRERWGETICALSPYWFAFAYGCAWAIALALLPLGYRPFIYFQF